MGDESTRSGWLFKILEERDGPRQAFGYVGRQRWRLAFLLALVGVCMIAGALLSSVV